jgi:hypothetical protein
MTTECYFTKAITRIDGEFGEGYAKNHPELLGAYIQASASDLNSATLAQQVRLGLREIAQSIEASSLAGLGTLAEGINEGLKDIAEKIDASVGVHDQEIAEALNEIASAIMARQPQHA